MNKVEVNIDQSSLSDSACILRWYRTVVQGYREPLSSSSMVYGSAFHKFMQVMHLCKGDIREARKQTMDVFNRPKRDNGQAYTMDANHLFVTCFNYWEDVILRDTNFQLLLLPNGEPAIECTFKFKYYEDDYVVVWLCGTIDRIGKIHNGCYCIRDFKTTGEYNVKQYLEEYRLSKQLRFYTLALKIMAEREPDSVLGQIGKTDIGCRIDAVFLKAKPSDNQYISSDVFIFRDDLIQKFRRVIDDQIVRLSNHICDNYFPAEGIVNDTCKGKYKCKFFQVCSAPTDMQPVLLERDFRKVQYDPLQFGNSL